LKVKNNFIILILIGFSFTACAGEPKNQAQPEKTQVKNESPANTEAEVKKEMPAKAKEIPKVTFVELGSVNCIPCKQMQPVMKAVEEEYPTQVKVEFIDVWTQKGKLDGEKYKIRVIPTQVFLDSLGKEYFRHEGFYPKEEVFKALKKGGIK